MIDRQDLKRELKMWREFAKAVSTFNQSVQNDLTGALTDQRGILRAALSAARDSLPGADYLEISLADQTRREMTVFATFESRNAEGEGESIHRQRSYRFDEEPTTPVARAFQDKTVFRVPVANDSGVLLSEGFPGMKQAIYAPILVDGGCLGVIAVRGKSQVEYPRQANEMLLLLGHLTGLYLRLQVASRNQTQTYRQFLHQLRNPVFQSLSRTQKIRQATGDKRLDAVCGLLGKARLLVINLRLFSNLAAGETIQPTLQTVGPGDLIRPLIELASDNRILWQGNRVGFHVDVESFEFAARMSIDMDLFEEAAGNVLDNFGKYGTPDSTTVVTASLVENTRFCLSVRSLSIPITADDAKLAGRRGWRGREARKRSVEGSGIGLWMARAILEAHNGQLEVMETDAKGYNENNEIRLVFPVIGQEGA